MEKIFIAILTLLLSVSTPYAACSGNNYKETIDVLYLNTDGTVFIDTSGIEADLNNCVPVTGIYISLMPDHLLRDQIYALLLTAHANRSLVEIRTKDTPGASCEVSYVVSRK